MNAKMVGAIVVLACLGLYFAADAAAQGGGTHQGTVVSTSAGKLVMKDSGGKEHSHSLDNSARITIKGEPGKLEDLKAGQKISVTTNHEGKVTAVATIDTP